MGYGLRVTPIGASYIPVCTELAERDDLVKWQKELAKKELEEFSKEWKETH